MHVGVLTLWLHLPGCTSLKEKRRRLKPLLHRLHREFNISVAEVGAQDAWQEAIVACALVSNDPKHAQQALQKVLRWVETHWGDGWIAQERLELR
ncbi:MAG: DUF503 domain-containing protein [Chloroflexi bacterium]|nr:DUF503 domain-containing protein [Chloroflexota bacterium]